MRPSECLLSMTVKEETVIKRIAYTGIITPGNTTVNGMKFFSVKTSTVF